MATVEAPTRTLISTARLNRPTGRRTYWTTLTATLTISVIIFLGPLYWMITGGLKTPYEYAQNPPTLFPTHPQYDNYTNAWTLINLGRLITNTAYYAAGALALILILDITAAYAFSKLKPPGNRLFLALMLATLMVPTTVLVIPQYVTVLHLPLLGYNLIDTPWAIWLPAVAGNAFNIFLLKRFFDSIPQDLLAAAAIDGAGPLRTLWSIIVPMSRPILGVISIFTITAVWKDFLWPLLVEPDAPYRTVNVGIVAFSKGVSPNIVIAGAVIAAIPTITFFLLFQKNIMAGLTTGGIRG